MLDTGLTRLDTVRGVEVHSTLKIQEVDEQLAAKKGGRKRA